MANLQNIQAESGIIATLIVHPEFILANDKLQATHFAITTNKILFQIIGELYKEGITNIDEFNLASKIDNSLDYIQQMEGVSLANIVSDSPYIARDTYAEYNTLANDVIDFAFRRKFLKTLQQFERKCGEEGIDISQLQNALYDKLNNISDEFLTNDNEGLLGDKIDTIYAEIVRRAQNGGGIPSKFPSLNDFVTYERGELVIFSAKRKVRKICPTNE